jgi:ferredoxin
MILIKENQMRARVNLEICIGCTLCVQICPEVFRMNDDKAVAYIVTIPKDLQDNCQKAAADCPVNAIMVEE